MRMLFRALKSLERAQEGLYNKIVPEPNLQSCAPPRRSRRWPDAPH